MSKKAYAVAGVDVDLGNHVKQGIQRAVRSTHGPEVLGRIGGFGGLFQPNFKGLREPVLVSSMDGVGTKLKVAFAAGRYDTVAEDLVNHCINDIAVIGARPLFFLDYLAAETLVPEVFQALIKGFTRACKAGGCALIGGETAQMPGMYQPGEFDLAGCIVGVVDRAKILDGRRVKPGDQIIGLASNGLHTNGYSLARRAIFDILKLGPESILEGSGKTVAAELLRVHKNYQPLLAALPAGVLKAAAHITGGGLIDNLPRVLPEGSAAHIQAQSWTVPTVFRVIERAAGVDPLEMYQVFNMGIGMALIVAAKDAPAVAKQTKGRIIGEIAAGEGDVRIDLARTRK